MFSFKRADRVKELMLKEISEIVRNELNDPRIKFVTVTEVKLAVNLRYAKVYISPMGSDEEKRLSFEGICNATSFIRRQLGKKMRIKYLPEIHFKWDHTQEESDRITQLLGTVTMEKGAEEKL